MTGAASVLGSSARGLLPLRRPRPWGMQRPATASSRRKPVGVGPGPVTAAPQPWRRPAAVLCALPSPSVAPSTGCSARPPTEVPVPAFAVTVAPEPARTHPARRAAVVRRAPGARGAGDRARPTAGRGGGPRRPGRPGLVRRAVAPDDLHLRRRRCHGTRPRGGARAHRDRYTAAGAARGSRTRSTASRSCCSTTPRSGWACGCRRGFRRGRPPRMSSPTSLCWRSPGCRSRAASGFHGSGILPLRARPTGDVDPAAGRGLSARPSTVHDARPRTPGSPDR